ncbi:MAG: hypothetical protein ACI9A7_001198 [Cyclobacteriaceae bacterium]|jgi:hypothetical protein
MGKIFNKAKEAEEAINEEVQEPSAEEVQFQKEFNKLNSIRDILFGENMQEYQKEFDEIKSIIRDNQDRTDNRISDMRTEIMDKINALEESVNARMTRTEESLSDKIADLKDAKTDRKALSSLFMDIARQLDS